VRSSGASVKGAGTQRLRQTSEWSFGAGGSVAHIHHEERSTGVIRSIAHPQAKEVAAPNCCQFAQHLSAGPYGFAACRT
jgi:hypothetical protein